LTAEQFENIKKMHPLGIGKPRDVAYSIAFLLADTGRWITGTTMIVAVISWYYLSNMKFQAQMGLLLALIMLINIFTALILIPTLVNLFRPKFLSRVNFHEGSSHSVQAAV
jgi:predicted RND superfamily exporter protein